MPIISALGAMSSRGLGEFAQLQAQGKYIEDYFSTYLYTGNGGASQTISNGIGLSDTAEWTTYKLQDGYTYGYQVNSDSSGNFYVINNTRPGSYVGAGITKYNSAWAVQWQRKLQENDTYGTGVWAASSGNVYISAYGNSSAYGLVAKYNSAGALQWQRKIYQNTSQLFGIIGDSSENIYAVGRFNDGTYEYGVLVKYNSSGAIQWQRKIQEQNSILVSVGIGPDGNIYTVGRAYSGSYYILLAKYNSSGVLQWQRKLYQGSSSGSGVAFDSAGNVYISGYANDGTTSYIILAKYNSSGTIQWVRSIRKNASAGNAVAVDASDNIYVGGYTYITATDYVGLIAKYNSSGTIQWQRFMYQNGQGNINSIITDASGNVYANGSGYDSTYYTCVLKLKADGLTVSGQAFVSMWNGDATDTSAGATDAAGTATDSAASATDAAGTATDSAGTLVASTATQAAVTGAGGLVWMKGRSGATDHALYDTARGAKLDLVSNTTAAQTTQTTGLTAFSASGFSIGSLAKINTNNATYASWTFRKQPKFFDIVTWTGDGTNNRSILHNLGSNPAIVIIKATSTTSSWAVAKSPFAYYTGYSYTGMYLNQSFAVGTTTANGLGVASTSSTNFVVQASTPDLEFSPNTNGVTYVAYLFASNAGGFGADGSQNVISCGSYVGTGASQSITLGYEPQYVLVKNATSAGWDWAVFNNMTGLNNTSSAYLNPNLSVAEQTGASPTIVANATGFNIVGSTAFNLNGDTFIYMAIRRGPMRTPTSGTSVFAPVTSNASFPRTITTNFPVDLTLNRLNSNANSTTAMDRLRGMVSGSYAVVYTNNTNAEATGTGSNWISAQNNTAIIDNNWSSAFSTIYWNFGRAPGFFDVVCYTGNSASHNLTVKPELVIIKERNATTDWYVGCTKTLNPFDQSNPQWDTLYLNTTAAKNSGFGAVDTLSISSFSSSLTSGTTKVAYLFASCPGVSKVGSYTGTGGTQTISCGFTGGARYVLIKRTDSTGDWWVWDTARGMVAGTDPRLAYNSTAAETNANWVYTTTGGFQIVTSDATVNANGGSYIFLAIS